MNSLITTQCQQCLYGICCCVYVCLCVTHQHCVKMAELNMMITQRLLF